MITYTYISDRWIQVVIVIRHLFDILVCCLHFGVDLCVAVETLKIGGFGVHG